MNRHNGNEEWEQGIGMETGMVKGNEEWGTFSDNICVTLKYYINVGSAPFSIPPTSPPYVLYNFSEHPPVA